MKARKTDSKLLTARIIYAALCLLFVLAPIGAYYLTSDPSLPEKSFIRTFIWIMTLALMFGVAWEVNKFRLFIRSEEELKERLKNEEG